MYLVKMRIQNKLELKCFGKKKYNINKIYFIFLVDINI